MTTHKVQLLVPAAGMGTRLGCDGPKALIDLGGRPMLVCTLARMVSLGLTRGAVVTAPPGALDTFQRLLDGAFPGEGMRAIAGGQERQESVEIGLDALDEDTEIVVVHDAARPFVDPASVKASIDAAVDMGAATVAIPAVDTVLVADDEGGLESTPGRAALWSCQTPQTFQVKVLREAHRMARAQGFAATDDATVVRRTGHRVRLVMGTPLNFKITTPGDLTLARLVIREQLA
jgi:2-C-methyl-D-erythritol 4-phosphate cytidylyltransferase